MSSIVVCGAGVVGLSVAMMLARDGHDVSVLESDPDSTPPDPAQAWESWQRKGVAQFHQPHNLFACFRHVCDEELPGITDELEKAGCVWADYLHPLPSRFTAATPRPEDDRLRFITGRRPVVESVMATAAENQAGVSVSRGVRVAGLLPGPAASGDAPGVAGVRTADGSEIRADLVVDATGRRTPSAAWLAELGAPPAYVESENSGFAYYTRYFTGAKRPRRLGAALTPIGTFSVLTIDGDNDTWSVTLFTSTKDAPMKALRDTKRFTQVVRACPMHAHWLDGEPITPILPIAGVLDCYRRFAVSGSPIVTGFAAVGDAWACTNPSAGRGLSLGLMHAQLLRNVVREHLDDPAAFANAFDARTEEAVAPFYRNQIREDRFRAAEMNALRNGLEPAAMTPRSAQILAAAGQDGDVLRGVLETVQCLALPEEVFQRPGIRERIKATDPVPPPPAPGPDRAQLLQLLSS